MPTYVYCFDGWRLDAGRRRIWNSDGDEIRLTSFELDMLVVFCQHPQEILSREQLAARIGGRIHSLDRAVDVRVARIRQKIEVDPKNPVIIKTIRQNGYWFAPDVAVVTPAGSAPPTDPGAGSP